MHPAQKFLIAFEELESIDRLASRRDMASVVLLVPAGAANIALVGTGIWWLNLPAAIGVALVLRRILLFRLTRKADVRRLSPMAEAARAYLTPTTAERSSGEA